MAITAQDINKLRQMTGAGMMDCKQALTEAEGNFEQAIDILRKKGQKVANKRADKDATEGAVIAKTSADGKKGAIIMINCETDFVGKNEDFVNFAFSTIEAGIASSATTVEELKSVDVNGLPVTERLHEIIGKINEKIEITVFEKVEGESVFAYIHPGNRLASIVAFNKVVAEEVGKNITMQIAAMSPVANEEADVPASVIEKEKEIAMELARNEGKAEAMLEKIAMGRVSKFLKESTLMNQEYIKDNKLNVRQYLQSIDKDLKVITFKRFQIGA